MAVTLVRRGGERNRVRKGFCVCLPTALHIQHAARELLVDWHNKVLAIKMVIFFFFLYQYYSSFSEVNHRHTKKMLYGTINTSQGGFAVLSRSPSQRKAMRLNHHEAFLLQALHWQQFKTTLFCFSRPASPASS